MLRLANQSEFTIQIWESDVAVAPSFRLPRSRENLGDRRFIPVDNGTPHGGVAEPVEDGYRPVTMAERVREQVGCT